MKPTNPNPYAAFLENLHSESPRAAYALESLKFKLMSQTGLNEAGALEVVSKIVAVTNPHPQNGNGKTKPQENKMTDQLNYDNLDDDEKEFVQGEISRIADSVKERRQSKKLAALIEAYKKEIYEARGKGHQRGEEIRAKYRKLGVNTDEIGFQVRHG